jgi:hypothetical protein
MPRRRPVDVDRVGDDGLLVPPEVPWWVRPLIWLDEQSRKPVPRGLRWTDRVPSWAVPLIVAGIFGALAALVLWWGRR